MKLFKKGCNIYNILSEILEINMINKWEGNCQFRHIRTTLKPFLCQCQINNEGIQREAACACVRDEQEMKFKVPNELWSNLFSL